MPKRKKQNRIGTKEKWTFTTKENKLSRTQESTIKISCLTAITILMLAS